MVEIANFDIYAINKFSNKLKDIHNKTRNPNNFLFECKQYNIMHNLQIQTKQS